MDTLIRMMHTTREWHEKESREAKEAYAAHNWGNTPDIMREILLTDAYNSWWSAEFAKRDQYLVEFHELEKMKPDSLIVASALVFLFRETHCPESVDRHCTTESQARMIGEVLDEIMHKNKAQ